MKKLFTFLMATLTSVFVMASIGNVPSDQTLASYYTPGDVCVCFFVPTDMNCNDIVLTGSFNGWSTNVSECAAAQPVVGYDGWYVASFGAEAEPDATNGIQAKPIILDVYGKFNWDYQVSSATILRGGVEIRSSGWLNEIDLINYSVNQPNIFTIDAWKNNPCTAIYHNYKITVISDGCDGNAVPYLIGTMNSWAFQEMLLDSEKTIENGAPTYYCTFKAAEGTPYQILSGLRDSTGEIVEMPAWSDASYLQEFVGDRWLRVNNGDNYLTGEDVEIVFDIRADSLRWARCYEEPVEHVVVKINLPTGAPSAGVEIIGSFDGWTGTPMLHLESGIWYAELDAKASDYFKIREAGTWENQLQFYDTENDEWEYIYDGFVCGQLWYDDTLDGMPVEMIELDLSDPNMYKWEVIQHHYATIYDGSNNGEIRGVGTFEAFAYYQLTAVPNNGYRFTQWSDSVTDNPRTIYLTKDTTFIAEFEKNVYSISTESTNPQWGTTLGDTSVLYNERVIISAEANYGYHFVYWNDGNRSNPRSVVVTKDITYRATFAKNIYYITKDVDAAKGSISGPSQAEYLDDVTLTAVPNNGYHFTQWSDGIKENPRTYVITKDTIVSVEFAIDKSGECGDNYALTWYYNSADKQLTITGNGALNSNYTFGIEAPAEMERLIIQEGVTSIGDGAFNGMCSLITTLALPTTVSSIGDNAFYGLNNRKFNKLSLPNNLISIGNNAFEGAAYLQNIYFGSALEEIGAYAFSGCTRVKEMTCLAEITPNVGTNALSSISSLATLNVPSDYLLDYQIDPNWSRFALKTIGATEVTVPDNNVNIAPDANTVTLTWPVNDAADSYTIIITSGGVVVCTITFGANGQLLGIAFAPGRNNNHPQAPAAKLTENGMQFTVTGLSSGTDYEYQVLAKDSNSEVLASYAGEFTTDGGTPTGITNLLGENAQTQKLLRDGQIFILRGEKIYTVTGQEVK